MRSASSSSMTSTSTPEQHDRRVYAPHEPQKAKVLLLLIEELHVNGREGILRTYRLATPGLCACPKGEAKCVLARHQAKKAS